MAVLHQFDYVFALGMIFAFLDAWNIGANDVGMGAQIMLIATRKGSAADVICCQQLCDQRQLAVVDHEASHADRLGHGILWCCSRRKPRGRYYSQQDHQCKSIQKGD